MLLLPESTWLLKWAFFSPCAGNILHLDTSLCCPQPAIQDSAVAMSLLARPLPLQPSDSSCLPLGGMLSFKTNYVTHSVHWKLLTFFTWGKSAAKCKEALEALCRLHSVPRRPLLLSSWYLLLEVTEYLFPLF